MCSGVCSVRESARGSVEDEEYKEGVEGMEGMEVGSILNVGVDLVVLEEDEGEEGGINVKVEFVSSISKLILICFFFLKLKITR